MTRYETRALTGGAYKDSRAKLDVVETHALEIVDGFEIATLCQRVKVENLADVHATNPNALPTCMRCRNRLRNASHG